MKGMLKPIKKMLGQKPRSNWRGWRYPNEDLEYVFNDEYETLQELIDAIKDFELANELTPLEDLRDVLEDYFCRSCAYYGQFCVEEDTMVEKKRTPVEDAVIKMNTMYRGVKAIAKIKTKGLQGKTLKIVDDETIKERVSICKNCPLNIGGKSIGHETLYIGDLEKAYNKNRDKLDAIHGEPKELGRCSRGCECKLKSKVLLHSEDFGTELFELHQIQLSNMVNAKRKDGKMCWQIQETMHQEHIDKCKKDRKVTETRLKHWGYKK